MLFYYLEKRSFDILRIIFLFWDGEILCFVQNEGEQIMINWSTEGVTETKLTKFRHVKGLFVP